MQKTILGIVAITVLGAVTAYYFYRDHNRYKITTTSEGTAYEVDTKTGKSWILSGNRKVLQEDPKPPEEAKELPSTELKKLEGTANITNIGWIECNIYNGSNYKITQLFIRITVSGTDGKEWINRIYQLTPEYGHDGTPLKHTMFHASLGFNLNKDKWSWGISKAKGYEQ